MYMYDNYRGMCLVSLADSLYDHKTSILSELCKDKHYQCLCLQENHRAKDPARPSISGMALVSKRSHNKNGSSVFVRDGLKVNTIYVCEETNVEFITVELPGLVVHSVNKPPAEQFLLPPLGSRNMPHTGDTPQLTTTETQLTCGLNQTTYHSHNAKLPK